MKTWIISTLCALCTICAQNTSAAEDSTRLSDKAIPLADPSILLDDSTYYIYGTSHANIGFQTYSSTDLVNWKGPNGILEGGFVFKKGAANFGDKGFWAPHVFKHENKYYMAYTANEYIAIATAPTPNGPFVQHPKSRIPSDVHMIDPFFFSDDGKLYLYHVRLDGSNKIYVAEMDQKIGFIKKETLTHCITAGEDAWENVNHDKWTVAEGPTVIKKAGTYFLLYSANGYENQDYAIGYATAKTPTGPWKRYEGNPIIHRSKIKLGDQPLFGTGHGDIFWDQEGQMKYVFHAHKSATSVHPRVSLTVNIDFKKSPTNPDEWILEVDPKSVHLLETE